MLKVFSVYFDKIQIFYQLNLIKWKHFISLIIDIDTVRTELQT